MHSKDLLFCLLRNEICGTEIKLDTDFTYDAESLYRLSKAHDLAHLVCDALQRNNILPKDETQTENFKREQRLAVCREMQMSSVTEIIREILQKNKIKFILLRGEAIRSLYPEPWMRTSCDIDVLVQEDDLDKALTVLKDSGFQTDGVKKYHDISLFYGKVHLELHYSVLEGISKIDKTLSKIWEYSVQTKGFEFVETPEYFVFHHIAHMSYHFLAGGCGVRPFIDLYILRENSVYNEKKLMRLLEISGLLKFYNGVLELVDIWFKGNKQSEISQVIERYVLSGGVYGSSKNEHNIKIIGNKNRFCYILSLVFLPYDNMCIIYPVLKKRKILLPFCYIHRIFSKLFGKSRKRAKQNLKEILSNDKKSINSVEKMLNYLGLKLEK